MRPRIITWLEARGLEALASVVPSPRVIYSLAIAALIALFVARVRPLGVSRIRGVDAAACAALGGLIGARLFYVLTTGQLSSFPRSTWLEASPGTASWGAYLGGLAGLLAYLRITQQQALQQLDVAASCAGLGPVIGRLACLLAGDDFGRPTTLPWAIRFPRASLPFNAHVDAGVLQPDAATSLPVHPLQLYLVANGLLVFLAVSGVWRRAGDRPGVTLGAYLVLYGVTRFCWEFLRDPAAGGASHGLSTSQIMCLLFAGAGSILATYRFWHRRPSRPKRQRDREEPSHELGSSSSNANRVFTGIRSAG